MMSNPYGLRGIRLCGIHIDSVCGDCGCKEVNFKVLQGGAPFANWIYGKVDDAACKSIIEEALAQGINYIDTAYWYGQGTSEANIGKALRALAVPRSSFNIGTKVCRYDTDPSKMFDFSAQRTLKQADEALRRLGLDYVDVLMAHDVEFADSDDIIVNETLPALQKVREAGKARYIGITGYPLAKLRSIVEKSEIKIDVILTYSRGTLHDESVLDFVDYFRSRGIGVINGAPTSMGLLAPQGPQDWHPATKELKALCAQARQLAHKEGVSIARLAVKHSLGLPCDSLLTGANSVDILRANVWSYQQPLSDHEKQVLENILKLFGDRRLHWEGIEIAALKK